MNRRPATALDSDDSGSDWDTTVAESPTHPVPRPSAAAAPVNSIDGDYATVTPKPRSSLKEGDAKRTKGKSPSSTPRRDNSQSNMTSPPPHLTSFQNALSGDYATVQEVSPDIPPRGYEGKGKLYTVPETDSLTSPQANIANWDDSDAEERVLKELQQNVEREKQRQQQLVAARDRKVTLAGGHSVSMDRAAMGADNRGYANSPTGSRSDESGEKWNRANETKQGRSPQSRKGLDGMSDGHQKSGMPMDISHPAYFRSPEQQGGTTPPMMMKDPSGKKCIVYFEEGNPHFLEIDEEKVDAFLPEKADKMEKVFRQVWREVFAGLRIFTSVFVLFVVELIVFLTHHIVRPLLLDSISTVGNFILKPLLTLLFNAIIQPVFSFLWNIFSSLYQAMEPVTRLLGNLFTQVAIVLRAFRLFTIQYSGRPDYRAEMEVV